MSRAQGGDAAMRISPLVDRTNLRFGASGREVVLTDLPPGIELRN
jgi:hypothetical protein